MNPLVRFLPLTFVAVLHAAQLSYYYHLLPDTVASHFGTNGLANDWMSKPQYLMLNAIMPGFALLLAVGLPALLPYLPTWMINIPHREYWLQPEHRPFAEHILRDILSWIGAFFYAVLIATNQLAIAANLRQPPRLSNSIYLILGVAALLVALWMWRLYRIFRLPTTR